MSEGANHGSAKNFKILCENVVTTPKGVQVLAAFLLRESNAILATKDSHQFASIAYSALASKVATEEEIVTVRRILNTIFIFFISLRGKNHLLKDRFQFNAFLKKF